MQKWEYITVEAVSMVGSLPIKNKQKTWEFEIGQIEGLNNLGADGWEVCGFLKNNVSYLWILKRQKE